MHYLYPAATWARAAKKSFSCFAVEKHEYHLVNSTLCNKMPLIVMCGYPCSGKTRRAHELREYFTQNTERQVHIVGDEVQGIDRSSVYAGEKLQSLTIIYCHVCVCYDNPEAKSLSNWESKTLYNLKWFAGLISSVG